MDHTQSILALAQARIRHELQLQQPVAYAGGLIFAAEFVDAAGWERIRAYAPQLILSSARARILNMLPSQGALCIDARALSFEALTQLIAGRAHGAPTVTPASSGLAHASAWITLIKQTGLIPALIFAEGMDAKNYLRADAHMLTAAVPIDVLRGETVSLPIDGAQASRLTSFRSRYDTAVHLALQVGELTSPAPLVRVHSSCVTGDLLGSLRCDCGNQLQQALAHMKEQGGILLYLHQEGRGIGITSKLRAYALQEQGYDTFAANELLGFEEDERDFSIASVMLATLGVKQIRLLTNNPDKLGAFASSGIQVVERVPLRADANTHNHAYMEAKKNKRGHL